MRRPSQSIWDTFPTLPCFPPCSLLLVLWSLHPPPCALTRLILAPWSQELLLVLFVISMLLPAFILVINHHHHNCHHHICRHHICTHHNCHCHLYIWPMTRRSGEIGKIVGVPIQNRLHGLHCRAQHWQYGNFPILIDWYSALMTLLSIDFHFAINFTFTFNFTDIPWLWLLSIFMPMLV